MMNARIASTNKQADTALRFRPRPPLPTRVRETTNGLKRCVGRSPVKRLFMGVALVTVTSVLAQAQATSTTVRGYVIDSACLFIKKLEKPVSEECALKCAKAGSPLVILADDGTIYFPISSEMPATGQNERLIKFAGDKVVVRGKAFERGGSHALVIEEISAAPTAR